jgi:hypothetical protein
MDATALKALQAPLKDKYREKPEAAVVTLKAEGRKARRAKWEASRKGRTSPKPAPPEGEGVLA